MNFKTQNHDTLMILKNLQWNFLKIYHQSYIDEP